MTLLYQLLLRNDTAANWTTANPVLGSGELGFENDTFKFKIGNGADLWSTLPYQGTSGALVAHGSTGSPNAITAVGGITVLGAQREYQFITGSGGPVDVTANPQITSGTTVGQELILQGTSNSNTVELNDGNGLSLNGPIVMGATIPGSQIYLVWTGTLWSEVSRK